MNDSFGGGFTQSGGDGKQESKSEGTLPVLIKQLLIQKDDVVKMWGMEYKMITLVALVRHIDHSSTKITYSLEDITGSINAHLWIEEGEAPATSGIMLNTYARVIGAVRIHGDVKSLMIYKIQPAKGINEVNTHYLEVINARYQAEEYYKRGAPSKAEGEGIKMEGVNSGLDTQVSTQGGPSGKELAIFNAIRASADTHQDTGINRQQLRAKFSAISEKEMTVLLDKLLSDGHIYSTIDCDHFLSCF